MYIMRNFHPFRGPREVASHNPKPRCVEGGADKAT